MFWFFYEYIFLIISGGYIVEWVYLNRKMKKKVIFKFWWSGNKDFRYWVLFIGMYIKWNMLMIFMGDNMFLKLYKILLYM